ncbi:8-oxo-dGTP diphosphatase MutT [Ferrimonas senticii]|uniref:8-oxo-dGTP diphosphatase MutT n=1 Tax=Ferrimonas senticii TaxID=394566 RepID=UPI0004801CFF|nr:8-oxo-dGTP diphosphatase MutT [Ferrimonas senticii]
MKIINVAIAVVFQDNHVLVALRHPEQHQGGLWEFPGGKVEANETFAQAAIRELAEEVGVIAPSAELIWQTSHDYGDRQVNLQAFAVRQWQGQPQSNEGNPLQWVALDKLSELEMPAANQPLLQLLAATI